MSLNIELSDEQIFSLVEQLPIEKKKELLDQLKFDEWMESPEALQLKKNRENEISSGKVLTIDEMKEKLRASGKNI